MELQSALGNVNWLSVIVAALSAFVLGSLWYTPVLFGKAWQREIKLSDAEISQSNMVMIFGLTFLLQFISALVLDMFIGPNANFSFGLTAGALVGLAWVATSFGVTYLFSRKSFTLYLIDAGYYVVFYIIMGGILGAW